MHAQSIAAVRVRFQETDLMGIVHHASYLGYMEVGRVEWLRRRGIAYSAWAAAGLHLAVVEVGLRYLAPARFDDDLDVVTSLTEVRAATARFTYRIVRPIDGVACVEGFTRLARVYEGGKLRRFSPEMIEALGRPETRAGS